MRHELAAAQGTAEIRCYSIHLGIDASLTCLMTRADFLALVVISWTGPQRQGSHGAIVFLAG
jgi:hypothetical protein